MEVQSVSLTTVTVTRARPVERPRPHDPEVRTYEWSKSHGRAYATRRDVDWPDLSAQTRASEPNAGPRYDDFEPSMSAEPRGWNDEPIDGAREFGEPTSWERVGTLGSGEAKDLESPEAILERIARRYFEKREPEPNIAWRHAALTPLPTEGYLTLRDLAPASSRPTSLDHRRAIAAFELHHREAS